MTAGHPPDPTRPRFALVAVGAAAGLLSGLLGVGGGLIMVPGLILVAGMAQHRAHATSLAAIVPIGIVGAIVFGQANSVDVLAAAVLAGGSLLGVQAGTRAMNRLSAERLALVFAGFVFLVALAMLFL